MRWDDAQVVILELLCTPAQQWVLLDDVAAALRAIDDKRPIEPGRWSTFGVRLRKPRSPDEDAYLRESLAQPDDPLADEREAMVLEVGGRGCHDGAPRKRRRSFAERSARRSFIPVHARSPGAR
jgi:hypothetical protein